jgi:chromosome segregation ATPase
MGKRYEIICRDLEKVAASETECKDQLVKAETRVEELCQNLDSERTKKEQCQKELDSLQKTTQKLKAERNSYKQKADSLTKEISRLCRCGRTLRDVERVLVDEDSRKIEIEVLRTQKKKALEDLHQYRTAYEQQLVAQLNLGVDGAAVKALEQNAELERVVSELTEYVNAKEMQLETMRQVNETLTEDLKQLAKVNMSKDEI